MHHRRQRRGELRRRALPEVRLHHAPRPRRDLVPARRPLVAPRRHGCRRPGLRPARRRVGSEGTLGIVTEVTVGLVPRARPSRRCWPRSPRRTPRAWPSRAIISAGIVPAAIEMMDRLTIEAVEAAVHAGYPDGEAALLVELDGPAPEVARCSAPSRRSAAPAAPRAAGRRATPPTARRMWKGRKAAFAAMGRCRPSYYVQDGVIPRTGLPEVLRGIARSRRVRDARRQRLPRGRRQPAPARPVRRRDPRPARAGRAGGRDPRPLPRGGRLDHRRARGRHGQGVPHAEDVRRPTTWP